MATLAGRLIRRITPAPLRRVFEGFWLTPLALGLVGLAAAFAVNALPDDLRWLAELAGPLDEDGARAAISAVAGAVISVFSIVLSLTFVALSLTAQQLSPRMLDFVLRQPIVQALTGVTLASFLFSASALSFGGAEAWRLGLAAPVSLGLATLTLVIVVAFAHRMTRVMRPDEMVARRGDALRDALAAELAPGALTSRAAAPPPDRADRALDSPFAGYVGAADVSALVALARARGGVLALEVAAGEFVLNGATLARLVGGDGPKDGDALAVARALALSNRSEAGAGALYEARALAEGAMRALSPGVNDPGTAMACFNRLMDAADRLAAADPAPNAAADRGGALRLVTRPVDMALLAERALDPAAWHARGDREVRAALSRLVRTVRGRARPPDAAALDRVLETLEDAG